MRIFLTFVTQLGILENSANYLAVTNKADIVSEERSFITKEIGLISINSDLKNIPVKIKLTLKKKYSTPNYFSETYWSHLVYSIYT